MKKRILITIIGIMILMPACGQASVLHYDSVQSLADFEISANSTAIFMENNPDLKLIDVREPSEFAESNIKGAINIPLGSLSEESLEKNGIRKTNEIILYCRSGRRSALAYEIIKPLGYLTSKSMAGGITAWVAEKL